MLSRFQLKDLVNATVFSPCRWKLNEISVFLNQNKKKINGPTYPVKKWSEKEILKF